MPRLSLRHTVLAASLLLLAGCNSSVHYQAAPDNTPRAELLQVPFPAGPAQVTLNSIIVLGGPGSWKREALWDEYVVTLRNPGPAPVTLTGAELIAPSGTIAPGDDPWKLEDATRQALQEYNNRAKEFSRTATPAVATVGGIAAGSAVAAAAMSTGGVTVIVMQGPLALVTIPSYLLTRAVLNQEDRRDIESQFRFRRLPQPLTLAPGQARTGALFFPITPEPRQLLVRVKDATGEHTLTLDLTPLAHPRPPPK